MFLLEVKRRNPFLFYIMLILMGCSMLTLKRTQSQNHTIAPFVNWDMYSRNLWQQDYYTVFEIKYNGNKRLNMRGPLNALRKESLYTPLDIYHRIHEEGLLNHLDSERIRTFRPFLKYSPRKKLFNTYEASARFEGWFQDRLGKISGETIRSLAVYEVRMNFHGDRIQVLATPKLMFRR